MQFYFIHIFKNLEKSNLTSIGRMPTSATQQCVHNTEVFSAKSTGSSPAHNIKHATGVHAVRLPPQDLPLGMRGR